MNQFSMRVGLFFINVATVFLCFFSSPQGFASTLKAGFAQVDISEAPNLPMGGYGTFFLKEPRLNTAGVHDPLLASAVVLESAQGQLAALVSVDAVGLSGVQVARIEGSLKKQLDPQLHLIIASTHTHHSPDTLGLWGSLPRSGRNAAYMQRLEAAVSEAVTQAYFERVAARVFRKTGRHRNSSSAAALAQDRSDEFTTLLLRTQDDNRLLGTLTQWSAHPTVLGMENKALSADFVGAFRAVLHNDTPVPHLYFNGAIGKVYPLIPEDNDPALVDDLFPNGDRDPSVTDDYRKVSTVGHRLAQAVLTTAEQPVAWDAAQSFSMCHTQVQFPVDNLLFKIASQLNVVETRVRFSRLRTRVSTLAFADLLFLTVPGEIFPKVLKQIPESLVRGRRPVFIGMGQDWLGYFVTPEDYDSDELKYWTGLSVHRNASGILLERLAQSIRGEACTQTWE